MQVDINSLTVSDLAELYRPPFRRWVRSNMVLSLDGNFAGSRGSSRELSSAADLRVLLLLRALSDVVVVGARTAVGEKYKSLRVREEFTEITEVAPRLCVVSGSLDISAAEDFLRNSAQRPVIITKRRNDHQWQSNLLNLQEVADIVVSENALSGSFIVDTLRNLGLEQILCEGGPSVLNLMAQDSTLDEMALTLAPIVVGQTPTQPPLGHTNSTWHRSFIGVADDHTFFRFTASPLHTQV
jgi:5-amino-6-(5-phosphoribosylamino)uracil reductase